MNPLVAAVHGKKKRWSATYAALLLVIGLAGGSTGRAAPPGSAEVPSAPPAGFPAPRDGFTPEQRFFIGYTQWACENIRPNQLRVEALTDPHSPGKYRVNGLMVNLPEFAKAFSCKVGQPMVKEKPCRIW